MDGLVHSVHDWSDEETNHGDVEAWPLAGGLAGGLAWPATATASSPHPPCPSVSGEKDS